MIRFDTQDLRGLAPPLAAFALLLAAGVAVIGIVQRMLDREERQLAAARIERVQARERMLRIAEEEREVKQKIDLYRSLSELNIIGPERRLEWIDALTRIRANRELLDLRYRVEPQRLLNSVPGKPANVDFNASTMTVELALLHEGELLGFLDDLRASGNAYYSIQRCAIQRAGQPAARAFTAPHLRASCQIDLITILDRGARS